MRNSQRAVCIAAVLSSTSASPDLPRIDDFRGGYQGVFLDTSLANSIPDQVAASIYPHAAAAGGLREIYTRSISSGWYVSGILQEEAWYVSLFPNGGGGIIWDGVGGPTDKNNDGLISVSDDFDFGLNLDFVEACASPMLHLKAAADSPGESIEVILANSASDFAVYNVPITTVGDYSDYFVPIFAPTFSTAGFDPSAVHAVALSSTTSANLLTNVRVSVLEGYCPSVPESGTWMAMAGLLGIAGILWRRRSGTAH